jgi:hypothetical protein
LAGLTVSAAGHRTFMRPAGNEDTLPVVGSLRELGFAFRLAGLRRRISVRCGVLVDFRCRLIRISLGLAGRDGLFGAFFPAGTHAGLRDARAGQSVAPRAGRDARHDYYGPHSRARTAIFSAEARGVRDEDRGIKAPEDLARSSLTPRPWWAWRQVRRGRHRLRLEAGGESRSEGCGAGNEMQHAAAVVVGHIAINRNACRPALSVVDTDATTASAARYSYLLRADAI